MRKIFHENHIYLVLVVVILLVEVFLTVPLLTDSFIMKGSSVAVILSVAHLLLFMCGVSGLMDRPMRMEHVFGAFGWLVSMIPIIGFLYHGFISFLIVKFILRELKVIREIQNEFIENGRKIDTTYVFSDRYTKDDILDEDDDI